MLVGDMQLPEGTILANMSVEGIPAELEDNPAEDKLFLCFGKVNYCYKYKAFK